MALHPISETSSLIEPTAQQ
ncbi:rCG22776 [Rattus norvegicus]|uniref:RCG22776 n=1 Tax=Rattus norvegicus TaxID=10116 RepID=A6JYH2_RAT|nr:rCG22776 [Rattus norvegicus]